MELVGLWRDLLVGSVAATIGGVATWAICRVFQKRPKGHTAQHQVAPDQTSWTRTITETAYSREWRL